jgi:hypothetical protein
VGFLPQANSRRVSVDYLGLDLEAVCVAEYSR